jgi:hypothetical protein
MDMMRRDTIGRIGVIVLTFVLLSSWTVAHAQTQIAADDAESYSSGFEGTNGGTGWGSGFQARTFGANDSGGTFLESGNRLIGGSQSFAIFSDDGSSGSGYAVTRSVSLTGTDTYRVEFRIRFDLDPSADQVAGFNISSTGSSAQTSWDDGQVLFVGTGGAGVWQYNVGNGLEAVSDGSGAAYPLNGGDIYKVSVDVTTNSSSDIEIFVENESAGTTSSIEQVSVPGGLGNLESIGFANGVVAPFQNLIFDDLSITQGPTTPIPVELAAFDALADGRSAVLTWSTLSETNNDRFVVEHAAPGAGFSPAGSVEGNGTTTQRSTYRFTVADLEPGTHRFRLRQYDIDGANELSEAISLNIGVDGLAVSGAAPHPVQGESAVNISVDSASPVRVELFNLLGQRVRTLFDGTVTPGRAERVAIRGADLPSGTYFVRTTADAGSDVQRITIVR